MLRINYPEEVESFHKDYLDILKTDQLQPKFDDFNNQLQALITDQPQYEQLQCLSLREILIGSFDNLCEWSFLINEALDGHNSLVETLKDIFNYSVATEKESERLPQRDGYIASFFKKNSKALNLSTCYFCNINYINAFVDRDDYADFLGFIKNASIRELKQLNGIGDTYANKILDHRDNVQKIEDLPISQKLTDKIVKSYHDAIPDKKHFTLDHLLDKATHPLLALSLYNFVPSCYSCNSQFKKSEQWITECVLSFLSPTSPTFDFPEKVKFKLFFTPTIGHNIRTVDDFCVRLHVPKNNQHRENYEAYQRAFKISARYAYHKNLSLDLITKKARYSESQLAEISKIVGQPINQVTKDIFGANLFEGNLEDIPFTKFLRDIARDIELIE